MILIADSGSTKTSWVLMNSQRNQLEPCQTSGINPFYQTEDDIFNILKSEFTLNINGLHSLYFYGAGCANPEKIDIVKRALNRLWCPENIVVDSDLMGAARSLCGQNPGIAAILGTGSNSCFYDGINIVKSVSPLGFMLGDEGSGAVIGKKLVADVLKQQLPDHICNIFWKSYQLSAAEILDRVYKQPFPNRFLAQFTRFIFQHIHEETLYALVKNSFIEFFVRNINQYSQAADMPVNFTGSIAWHFSAPLKDAAMETGHRIGQITMDPMKGLIKYHSKI